MITELTHQLSAGQSLADAQVRDVIQALTSEAVTPASKAEFLSALAAKGETIEEIAAFARELRALAIQPPLDAATRSGIILDVVGTGGDKFNSFNISTTAALLCAAAGVKVAKHGNRAVTSQSGSADVLEALGIRIDLSPEESAAALREYGFTFFFAPRYHPAFRHIAPARKLCAERGQRTIFNILGPLLNPAKPTAQLLGAPQPALCEPLARVLQSLGMQRGLVACGRAGEACLDELSTLGDNTIAEFYQGQALAVSQVDFSALGYAPATRTDLVGGDKFANAETTRRILSGQERGPKRDAALLNAAAALFVAGRAPSITAGWELAASLIAEGAAAAKLQELVHR